MLPAESCLSRHAGAGPACFAHLANDGRHGQQADRCNSRLQERGHLQAIKAIPALDSNSLDWAASEILWDYGDKFWLGSSNLS